MELGALVRNQAVENRQHLFPVLVHPVQIMTERALKVFGADPLVRNGPGDVDILPKRLERMAAQKQPVKERGLPLRRQRIEIVSCNHRLKRFWRKRHF